MAVQKPKNIEYICSACGIKTARIISSGRSVPGSCYKKNNKPHSWVINRKF